MKSLVFIITLPLILTSCAMFEQRSYYDIMSENTAPMWVPNRDFQVVSGDTGRTYRNYDEIMERTPGSYQNYEDQEYAYSIKSELVKLENVQNEKDYELYDRYRYHFGTDSERIYFLRLNPRDRVSYLSAKGFMGNDQRSYNPSAERAYARAYDEGNYSSGPNYQDQYPSLPANQWMPRDTSRAPASIEYAR